MSDSGLCSYIFFGSLKGLSACRDGFPNDALFRLILNQKNHGAFAPGYLSFGEVETAFSGEVIAGFRKFYHNHIPVQEVAHFAM
jgi:hypothetical protein